MRNLWIRFRRDEQGITAIEYATIAGLLSIAIAVVVGELGTEVANLFASAKNAF